MQAWPLLLPPLARFAIGLLLVAIVPLLCRRIGAPHSWQAGPSATAPTRA